MKISHPLERKRHRLTVMAVLLLTSIGAANADDSKTCDKAYTKQQYAKALQACSKAARRGDAVAQYRLGNQYEFGVGIAQNYVQAIGWYRLAAEQGNADAQHSLGMMYADGQGVAQDKLRAHMWFNLAAAKDDWYGRARDNVAKRMTREQIARAQKMATDCTAKNYKAC